MRVERDIVILVLGGCLLLWMRVYYVQFSFFQFNVWLPCLCLCENRKQQQQQQRNSKHNESTLITIHWRKYVDDFARRIELIVDNNNNHHRRHHWHRVDMFFFYYFYWIIIFASRLASSRWWAIPNAQISNAQPTKTFIDRSMEFRNDPKLNKSDVFFCCFFFSDASKTMKNASIDCIALLMNSFHLSHRPAFSLRENDIYFFVLIMSLWSLLMQFFFPFFQNVCFSSLFRCWWSEGEKAKIGLAQCVDGAMASSMQINY